MYYIDLLQSLFFVQVSQNGHFGLNQSWQQLASLEDSCLCMCNVKCTSSYGRDLKLTTESSMCRTVLKRVKRKYLRRLLLSSQIWRAKKLLPSTTQTQTLLTTPNQKTAELRSSQSKFCIPSKILSGDDCLPPAGSSRFNVLKSPLLLLFNPYVSLQANVHTCNHP